MPHVPLPPERRVRSAVLGAIFFGVLLAGFGLLGMRPGQPLPPWIWGCAAAGGAALVAGSLPAALGRPAWARRTAVLGLALCAPALVLLYGASLYLGKSNPFTTILGFSAAGCVRGILFYNSAEIRGYFETRP